MQYFDPETNESYVPYVIETSIGVDRTVLAVLSGAYAQETLENGEERVVMKFHPALAPVKVAVLPLVKKDGLPELAREIMSSLKYRRQDAIGTPLCVTIDHDSLNDRCVTLRDRDTMQQERVPIEKLAEIVDKKVNLKYLLEKVR